MLQHGGCKSGTLFSKFPKFWKSKCHVSRNSVLDMNGAMLDCMLIVLLWHVMWVQWAALLEPWLIHGPFTNFRDELERTPEKQNSKFFFSFRHHSVSDTETPTGEERSGHDNVWEHSLSHGVYSAVPQRRSWRSSMPKTSCALSNPERVLRWANQASSGISSSMSAFSCYVSRWTSQAELALYVEKRKVSYNWFQPYIPNSGNHHSINCQMTSKIVLYFASRNFMVYLVSKKEAPKPHIPILLYMCRVY